jgi:hypothetical protein
MKRGLALLACAFAFTGCVARTPTEDEVAGTWRFDSTGTEPIKGEADLGEIRFNRDGTFQARNVSGRVLKIRDEALHDGRGTWEIDTSKGPIEKLIDRPIIRLVYDKHGTPFIAFYSVYQGGQEMSFVGDEESGEWVRYRKVQ